MQSKSVTHYTLVKVLFVACVLAVCVMILALAITNDRDKADFTPPPFEENAIKGEPNVPKELDYNLFFKENIPYSFSLCGRIMTEDTVAFVYFTNPKENDCWLRLRILDEDGKILGQSGILRPGEYVESVVLSHTLPKETKITLKIMGYEKQTYRSIGAIHINTTIAYENDPN